VPTIFRNRLQCIVNVILNCAPADYSLQLRSNHLAEHFFAKMRHLFQQIEGIVTVVLCSLASVIFLRKEWNFFGF
jgi:hypothetical protein